MEFKIDIAKKHFWALMITIILAGAGLFAYAQSTNTQGHSMAEITDFVVEQGTINHGDNINTVVPSGFTRDECRWTLSVYEAPITSTSADYEESFARAYTDSSGVVHVEWINQWAPNNYYVRYKINTPTGSVRVTDDPYYDGSDTSVSHLSGGIANYFILCTK